MPEQQQEVKSLLLDWIEKTFNTSTCKDFPKISIVKSFNDSSEVVKFVEWFLGIKAISPLTIGLYNRSKNIIYVKDRGIDMLPEMKRTFIHELLHYIEKKLGYTPGLYNSNSLDYIKHGKTKITNPYKYLELKGYLESEALVEGASYIITSNKLSMDKLLEYYFWSDKIKLSRLGKLLSYLCLDKKHRGQIEKLSREGITYRVTMMVGYYFSELVKKEEEI